jgi:hypothetical protein
VLHTKATTNLGPSPTFKIGHLLGNCNVATIGIELYVPPRVIDGYRWLPTSTAYARQYFTLLPGNTPMSSAWVDPGG